MRLDLTKWGGSKLRRRLDAVVDPTPEGKEATSLFFPFVADAARAVNDHEERLVALEARLAAKPFPGIWIAWGFAEGFREGQLTPVQFAQKARAAGYRWAALEHDDYGNAGRWGPFRHACQSEGILPGVWFTEGGHIADTPSDASFAIAECEGPGDYEGVTAAIKHLMLPRCPLAIITNFNVPLITPEGVPRPEMAAPLIEAGFRCLTEAYLGDNPNATPDNLDRMARGCGWPSSQPVFGVYNAPASAYDPWRSWPGASDYLAEYLL